MIFHFCGLIILLCTTGVLAQSTPGANSPDNAFQRGLIALKDNHLEIALKELTAAERQVPSDARIRNFRGVTLARLGRSDEAAQEYHEAVRLDPHMGDAYRNLGLLEWTEHRLDVAAADLRHALALAADDSFAHYYLGRVLLDSKDYAEAVSELNRSRVPWPEDTDFLIELAVAYNTISHSRVNPAMFYGPDSTLRELTSLRRTIGKLQPMLTSTSRVHKRSPRRRNWLLAGPCWALQKRT